MVLKIKSASFKSIKDGVKQALKGCEEHKHVQKKAGRCKNVGMVDFKYAGIVYKVKKKLPFLSR